MSSVTQKYAVLIERLNRLQNELKQTEEFIAYQDSNFEIKVNPQKNVVYVVSGNVSEVTLPSDKIPDNFKIKIVSRLGNSILIKSEQKMYSPLYAPRSGTKLFYLETNKTMQLEFFVNAWNFFI